MFITDGPVAYDVTVTLAAIGVGLLGRIECEIYESIEDVELVAGADVSPDARDAFEDEFGVPTYGDYETLLGQHAAELDAVSVVTPHTLHYEHASACLEQDLHVFLEKPLTTDLDDAIALVDESERRNLVLQVGYQRHFDPVFQEIKRVLDSERIGNVHMATCYLGQEWITDHDGSWRTNPALSGGGQLYDSGSHLIDTLLWTLDADPVDVTASIDHQGADVDVNSALTVTLDCDGQRVLSTIAVSGDGTEPEPTEGLVIWGTAGSISYLDGTLRVAERDGVEYTADVEQADFETNTRAKLTAFVDAIRTDGRSPVPPEFGATVTALTEAAYEADESGERVTVPEIETQTAVEQ